MNDEQRLSRMETLWTVVHRAHSDETLEAAAARQQLIDQYGGAVKRYLLGALRNENDANEVFQEFSLRMVRGDFHRADPNRGRFRQFVKTSLFRMIVDYQRWQGKRERQLQLGDDALPERVSNEPDEELFTKKWRSELIENTLTRLRKIDERAGSHLFAILNLRIVNPKLRSTELAQLATETLGKRISAENFRAILRRARVRFADLMIDEVNQTLHQPTREALESELADLRLLEYCKPSLDEGSP